MKWFTPHKHYGFIISEEGEDVFFHEQQIVRNKVDEADKGQIALFHERYAEKDPAALNVELIKE